MRDYWLGGFCTKDGEGEAMDSSEGFVIFSVLGKSMYALLFLFFIVFILIYLSIKYDVRALKERKKEKEEFERLDNQDEKESLEDIPCHEKGENFKVRSLSLQCENELENGEICGGTFFAHFDECNVTVCVHGTLIIKIQCNSCKQETETFITIETLWKYSKSVYYAESAEKIENDNRPYPTQYL